jgi:hypothetical protein
MKEYKVISIESRLKSHRKYESLKETIEELTIEINRYLSNGAILNGGISICIKNDGKYIVSQAITITRYPPPDGDEEC